MSRARKRVNTTSVNLAAATSDGPHRAPYVRDQPLKRV